MSDRKKDSTERGEINVLLMLPVMYMLNWIARFYILVLIDLSADVSILLDINKTV